jgi:hypothetical protein
MLTYFFASMLRITKLPELIVRWRILLRLLRVILDLCSAQKFVQIMFLYMFQLS